ncbi:MAG: hypothetical protein WD555_05845 [Fulvivirga sp.]
MIEKGLEKEYREGILKVEKVISEWKSGSIKSKDSYLKMYETLIGHDKYIGRKYGELKGSDYLFIIAKQLGDGVISVEDVMDFDDDVKQKLSFLSGMDLI